MGTAQGTITQTGFHSNANFARNLFAKVDRKLSEEIRAHVDLSTEVRIKEGLTPGQARRAALVSLLV